MKIKYTNTKEDAVEWQLHHFHNSKTYQRQVFLTRLACACIPIAILLLPAIGKSFFVNMVLCLGLIVYFYIKTPKTMQKSISKSMLKTLEEGQNKGFLCEHVLEITNDNLIETTDMGGQTSRWESIEKICTTEQHTFIYIGSVQAHIIPRGKIIEGDYDSFLEALQEKYKV